MTERQNFWGGWQERISALRNVPAVLKIVWDSGPGVVIFGLVSRLFAALMPVGLLWITKLIIDGIVHAVSDSSAGASWLLVAGGRGIFPGSTQQYSPPHDRLLRFVTRG